MSAKMENDWKHWRLRREETGLAWLELDKADSSTNVLSPELMNEFAGVLDALDAAPSDRALRLSSSYEFRSHKADHLVHQAGLQHPRHVVGVDRSCEDQTDNNSEEERDPS